MAQSTTFIVPVYNEEHRILATLDEVIRFVDARPEPAELLLVDDGSTDRTPDLIRDHIAGHPCARLIRYEPNRGKGGAIAEGMKHAANDLVFFFDIDLATPLATTEPVLQQFADPAVDVVIGTRIASAAHVRKSQPWLRRSLGEVFRMMSRLLVPGVSDFTCGFKAFRRPVGQHLFAAARVADWSFDTEVLFLARTCGYRIAEVPVEWFHVEGSKVRMLRNGIVSFWQLVAMAVRHALGGYSAALRNRPLPGTSAPR